MDIYLRDGVSIIEQLKPYKMFKTDGVVRYCFHQMRGIVETTLGYDTRGCGKQFHPDTGDFTDWHKMKKLPKKDPDGKDKGSSQIWYSEYRTDIISGNWKETPYMDYWHWQLKAVFRREVRNDQTNSIYVGTPDGINLKKLKSQPNEWQLEILQEWNRAFSHLADKHGWIKIELWW